MQVKHKINELGESVTKLLRSDVPEPWSYVELVEPRSFFKAWNRDDRVYKMMAKHLA